MRKVRIKSVPPTPMKDGGSTSNYQGNYIYPMYIPDEFVEHKLTAYETLQPVKDGTENLEAELGEEAYLPDVGGLAAKYKIGGKKHYDGGTPLNLPEDAFIYSDTKKLKIKDPEILKMFGKTGGEKQKGFTPAKLASKYDINEYRTALADKDTDDIQRRTSESMIGNYNLKLAKLALVQESMKGFPQGIPAVALPYFATSGINPEDALPLRHPGDSNQQSPSENQPEAEQAMGKYGMQVNPYMQLGGFTQNPFDMYTPPMQPAMQNGGAQDWANMGNPVFQGGGTKSSYVDLAKQLDTEVTNTLKKEAIQKAKEKAEKEAKAKLDKYLGSRTDIIADADKYLPKLFNKYKQVEKQRSQHGYEAPFNYFESPEEILKQISALEKRKEKAAGELNRFNSIQNNYPQPNPNGKAVAASEMYGIPAMQHAPVSEEPLEDLTELDPTPDEIRQLLKEGHHFTIKGKAY